MHDSMALRRLQLLMGALVANGVRSSIVALSIYPSRAMSRLFRIECLGTLLCFRASAHRRTLLAPVDRRALRDTLHGSGKDGAAGWLTAMYLGLMPVLGVLVVDSIQMYRRA